MGSNGGTPEFLTDALKFGINLGLQRMERLDDILGNPQDDFKCIHIAGTNGKGSTAAYTASILAASGLKVGLYTSPFLERFSERMRVIDGREGLDLLLEDETVGEIDAETLAELSDKVKTASDKMVEEGMEHPTEFELVTAICYLWFSMEKVDVAVLETGLGGRLDSTNVVKKPVCTVITAIGMDHTDRLGNTIGEIAGEKAGILKEGVPCVICFPEQMLLTPEQQAEVRRVMEAKALEMHSPVTYAVGEDDSISFTDDARMHFAYKGSEYTTRLLGRHQVRNAAAAIEACKIAGVSPEDISYGIENTVWKGRCECLSFDPVVILDGGHNSQCAESLASVLREMMGGKIYGKDMRVVMGVMKDKDPDKMLEVLRDGGVKMSEVYTVNVNNPRTMSDSELANIVKVVYNDQVKVIPSGDANKAVLAAYEMSLKDKMPLLITGSLYLLGEIRGAIRAETGKRI